MGDGDGEADGDADADALAVAVGAALGLGDASTVDGRTRATTSRPLRSWSWRVWPRDSTRATPCIAARKAVSCAMTSSGQASRVVASGPMATTPEVIEYGPWYVLQPAEPPTFVKRKTAVISVPGSTADTVFGARLVRVDHP